MRDTARFDALDGLRGFAALAVLLFHVCQVQAPWVFPRGYLAVDFFFMLSGFVIAFAYEARLEAGMPLSSFMTARLIRLYPLILVGLLLGVVRNAHVGRAAELIAALATGLFLLPAPAPVRVDERFMIPLNTPAWSLSFEMLINVVYGWAAPFLSNKVLKAIIAVSVVVLITTIAQHHSADFGSRSDDFLLGTVRVCFSFSVGVWLYRLWHADRLWTVRLPLMAAIALLGCAMMIPIGTPASAGVDAVAIVLVAPLLVTAGSRLELASRTAKWCRFAGELSYPVYILQGSLTPRLRDLPATLHLTGFVAAAAMIVAVVVYVFFAWAVLRFFDRPARRALTSVLLKRPQPMPAQTAP